MTDDRDILDRARDALDGITDGPWRWTTPRHGVPDLECRAGDPDVYAYDQTVLEASHSGECGCRSACELELTITDADRAFIAAARTLVPELIDALEAARDSAAQWEGLWRQDQETAATALRERDQALAEVERLRGNQRVEVVEGWHGIAKGSD